LGERTWIVFEHVAVVGASGAVGRVMLELLAQRRFPLRSLRLLASRRSAGASVTFDGTDYTIGELTPQAFDGIDLVLASTPDDVAREQLPHAVRAGAVVIDESAAWRMDPTVPLVVPEVNAHALARHQGLIASPNCSTTQLVVALKPLHDAARVRRVIVSSYQAVSGAGAAASRELDEQTREVLDGGQPQAEAFSHPIAFNCIPRIGSVKEAGYTSEEWKMVRETQKILEDETIRICATCVRVPVRNSHSETVVVETQRKLSAGEARELFAATPGITVVDEPAQDRYPMPLNCSGSDDVFIGRVREDPSHSHALAFWCVSDNLRKGAATNAVQIAEHLKQIAEAAGTAKKPVRSA
jgi:aspartate-semialdehyde dehydrogenase